MRRSAASHEVARRGDVARLGRDAGERVEGEDLDGGVVVARGRRRGSRRAARSAPATPSRGVERRQQALAERGLLAAAGGAVPRGRRLERRPRRRDPAERAQDAAEVDPGERRQPHVAGGLGLLDRELQRGGAGRRSRRPGTARVRGSRPGRPRSAGSRAVATSPRRGRCGGRRRRTGARGGPARRASRRGGRAATGRRPISQPVLDLVASLDGAHAVAGRDRGPGGEERSSRPGPTAGPARRRARGCDRSAPAPAPNSPWCDTT